jgi:hypothetical protein
VKLRQGVGVGRSGVSEQGLGNRNTPLY